MPRFLHRHKSTEFFHTLPFIREQLNKLPRSRSLRLSKRRKKEKDGRGRRGLRFWHDVPETPRSDSSHRSKFRETFDECNEFRENHNIVEKSYDDYEEGDDEEDEGGYTSEDSDQPLLESPSLEYTAELSGTEGQEMMFMEAGVQTQAREDGPYLLRPPPRRAGSLNKTRISSKRASQEKASLGFMDDPNTRIRLSERNIVIPPRRSSSIERRRASFDREIESRGSGYHASVISSSISSSTTPLDNRVLGKTVGNFLSQSRRNSIQQEARSFASPIDEEAGEAVETHSKITEEDLHNSSRAGSPIPWCGEQHLAVGEVDEKLVEEKASLASSSTSDLPSLPRRVMKIPANRKWRNAHKNYFPPGASAMPQDLVVRICNRYRNEHEGKGQDRRHRYL